MFSPEVRGDVEEKKLHQRKRGMNHSRTNLPPLSVLTHTHHCSQLRLQDRWMSTYSLLSSHKEGKDTTKQQFIPLLLSTSVRRG